MPSPFTEELSRSRNGGLNMGLMVQAQVAIPVIGALGTEEQKRLFLEPASQGEQVAALAVSEPRMPTRSPGGATSPSSSTGARPAAASPTG